MEGINLQKKGHGFIPTLCLLGLPTPVPGYAQACGISFDQ